MVHPGGRRLNPAEPPLPHDIVPGHGNLGVAAENVGGEKLLGDAFLAGVDDLGLRRGCRDLGDVPGLDRVTEDDSRRTALPSLAISVGLAYYKVVVSRRQIGKSSGERGAFSLADYRRQLGAGAVIALVLLRLAIGWHFFREGLGKLAYDEGTRQYHIAFSAEGFLAQAKGPWAAKFKAWAPNVHDWVGLLAVPRQNHEPTAEEAAQQAKSQAEYNERQAQASKNGGTSPVEFPPAAPYHDWAARIAEDWKAILSNVTAIPGLSEEQRHRAAEVFSQRVQQLTDYLAAQADAITDYQHELWRLDGWRDDARSSRRSVSAKADRDQSC